VRVAEWNLDDIEICSHYKGDEGQRPDQSRNQDGMREFVGIRLCNLAS
jgi:hypothetical protein